MTYKELIDHCNSMDRCELCRFFENKKCSKIRFLKIIAKFFSSEIPEKGNKNSAYWIIIPAESPFEYDKKKCSRCGTVFSDPQKYPFCPVCSSTMNTKEN